MKTKKQYYIETETYTWWALPLSLIFLTWTILCARALNKYYSSVIYNSDPLVETILFINFCIYVILSLFFAITFTIKNRVKKEVFMDNDKHKIKLFNLTKKQIELLEAEREKEK